MRLDFYRVRIAKIVKAGCYVLEWSQVVKVRASYYILVKDYEDKPIFLLHNMPNESCITTNMH